MQKVMPQKLNNYIIVDVSVDNLDREESGFSATLRLDIRSKEEFDAWLKEHETLSACTYRVLKTKPSDGKYVVYKVVLCTACVLRQHIVNISEPTFTVIILNNFLVSKATTRPVFIDSHPVD